MAKEGKKFNKKLLFTVAIPALIMVVIIGVVGVSFAWFTDSVTAEIATINLSVADVFVMDFVLDENTDKIYSGQTGFDSNGMLITSPDNNDKAFVAPFNLRLDTGNFSADFTCSIIAVRIHNDTTGNVNEISINESTTDLTISDIPLGFTWYISGSDKWYTPYGTLAVDDGVGIPAQGAFGDLDFSVKVQNESFIADASDVDANSYNYTFNIVFAPEKLFWQQYSGIEATRDKSATDTYGDLSADGGFRSTKWNAINKYSSQVYSGYTFEFKVMLEVSSVTALQGGTE